MKLQGKLRVWDQNDLAIGLPKEFHLDRFFHQTSNLASILANGWNTSHRSGVRRLYGNGVYWATPNRFWPKAGGNVIEARLDLSCHREFESPEELASHLRAFGINNQGDSHQQRITEYFLSENITSVSFPEEVGEAAVVNQLLGTPNRTFVVYDPNVIFVVAVA